MAQKSFIETKNTFDATMRAVRGELLDSKKNNPKWIIKNMGTYMKLIE